MSDSQQQIECPGCMPGSDLTPVYCANCYTSRVDQVEQLIAALEAEQEDNRRQRETLDKLRLRACDDCMYRPKDKSVWPCSLRRGQAATGCAACVRWEPEAAAALRERCDDARSSI